MAEYGVGVADVRRCDKAPPKKNTILEEAERNGQRRCKRADGGRHGMGAFR